MAENISKNPFMNAKGTTCKSFRIGKKSIQFASSAVTSNPDEIYRKYRNMVAEVDDAGNYVVYDCEIPMNGIRCVMNRGDGRSYAIVLNNGQEIPLSPSAAAVSWDENPDDGSNKMIVIYDATGGRFRKSAYDIMVSDELPGVDIDASLTGIDRLNAIAKAFNESNIDFDKKMPTMQTVIDYVGSFSDILAARTSGELKGKLDSH